MCRPREGFFMPPFFKLKGHVYILNGANLWGFRIFFFLLVLILVSFNIIFECKELDEVQNNYLASVSLIIRKRKQLKYFYII